MRRYRTAFARGRSSAYGTIDFFYGNDLFCDRQEIGAAAGCERGETIRDDGHFLCRIGSGPICHYGEENDSLSSVG